MSVQVPLFEKGDKKASKVAAKVEEIVGEGFDVAKFVENFEVLAEVGAGVEQLRGLVLHLAVRGRLLQESPLSLEETPRSNGLSVPFGLPKGWVWRRVDELGELKLGRQRSPKNHTGPNMRPYLRVANVHEARIDTSDVLEMNFEPAEAERFLLKPNDVLLNEGQSYEYVGRPAIYRGEVEGACFQNTLIRFRPGKQVLAEFALAVFRAYMRTGRFRREAQQTTNIAHLSLGRLAEIEFPLPPFGEQKRIATKVDQLMALCDELEAKQTKKRETGARLTKSALDALTSAEGPDEFDAAWKRVVENFDVLIDRAEKVGELRGAIRNLAIRGVLTRRKHGEAPASELLVRLEHERNRRVKNKEARRTEPLPVVAPDEVPFGLPPSWAWTRLGDLCWKVADGPHFSPNYVTKEQGVPFLSGRNIKVDGFELESVKYVSVEDHNAFCERTKPEPGDILYTKGGTTGVALVNDLDFEFSVWVHVAVLKVEPASVFAPYVAMALNSPHCYAQSQRLTHGTGNRDLGLTRMVKITLPLPPLEEQRRIVAKVEQLMKVCDEVEVRLRRADEGAAKLVEAVVQELVA